MKASVRTEQVPFFRSNFRNEIVRGSLQLTEAIPLDEIFDSEAQHAPDINGASGCGSAVLCLLITPAMLIPCDLVRLLSSYNEDVISVKIMQHSASRGKYLSLIYTTGTAVADAIKHKFHGRNLTSLDPTVALLYGVKAVAFDPAPSNDTATESMGNLKSGLGSDLGDLLPLERQISSGDHDCICVLCLEEMDLSKGQSQSARTFTMCCGHTFHTNCVMKLENPQCPVCRYQHEDDMEALSCCQECAWRGCNSAEDATAGNIGTTTEIDNDLWLCLVCGYIGLVIFRAISFCRSNIGIWQGVAAVITDIYTSTMKNIYMPTL